jgi:hypothetical protein
MVSRIKRCRAGLGMVVAGCLLAVVVGCGSSSKPASPAAPTTRAPVAQAQAVAMLEGQLATLLGEHVALAADATGAALAGRSDEFNAATAELDKNSVALADLIGSVYGTEARDAFLKGWRDHIGFFVDYTQAVAARDDAKKQQALADLDRYAHQLAQFFNAANGMPLDATVTLMQAHIQTLTTVIDAQAAGDAPAAYAKLRQAMDHMQMLAEPLALATARAFPQRFAAAN